MCLTLLLPCRLVPTQVIIVDEFTGRTMPGRRWSDGLHQAVEAKEALDINAESITLASVSYQAFFRWDDRCVGLSRKLFVGIHQPYQAFFR
jgi:preprotein translocase subunit SecA